MSTIILDRQRLRSITLLTALFLLLLGGYKSCLKSSNPERVSGKGSSYVPNSPKGGAGSGSIVTLALNKAPKHVRQMINHLKAVKHKNPPKGFKGGREFRNREGKLPKGKTYYEYDVHPLRPGISRGPERLVIDQNKTVFYYTKDHYNTFIKIQQ